jgi:hypothetical protein
MVPETARDADLQPFLVEFAARMGNLSIDDSTAPSALCISAGLLSPTVRHVVIDESSAAEQRVSYLELIGRDAFDELVEQLTRSIQVSLGVPLGECGPLDVSLNEGPWMEAACSGSVVTLGRHPQCGLQMVDAKTSFVSRLQCIVVRAHSRLVVYDVTQHGHACIM